jgi:hypothetical protein
MVAKLVVGHRHRSIKSINFSRFAWKLCAREMLLLLLLLELFCCRVSAAAIAASVTLTPRRAFV